MQRISINKLKLNFNQALGIILAVLVIALIALYALGPAAQVLIVETTLPGNNEKIDRLSKVTAIFNYAPTEPRLRINNNSELLVLSKEANNRYSVNITQTYEYGDYTLEILEGDKVLKSWNITIASSDTIDPISNYPTDYQQRPTTKRLEDLKKALPYTGPTFSVTIFEGNIILGYSAENPISLQGALQFIAEYGFDVNDSVIKLSPYYTADDIIEQ